MASGSIGVGRVMNQGWEEVEQRLVVGCSWKEKKKRKKKVMSGEGKCGQLGTEFSQFLIGPSLLFFFFN